MKKFMRMATGLCLVATMAMVSCKKGDNPADKVKGGSGLPKAEAAAKGSEIAFIEVDSLATAYQFCIDGQKELEAKHNNFRQQLAAKERALQTAAEQFQKKYQSGGFTNEADFNKAQGALQNQQLQLQKFQEQLETQMAEATNAYQQTLRDSLNNFLKEYNKDRRYKMILSKSGDNMLYADKSLDITKEVINGLNKRYKKK